MRTLLRVGLTVLAAVQVVLGTWTALFPRSFYDDVPTVDLTPPYSEHLFRDFGGATLGIAVVLVAAAVWLERRLVIVSLVAYLAFSVPHLAFHAGHLQELPAGQAAVLLVLLALSVVLPLALIPVARSEPSEPRLQRVR
ncbi:MAG TPA: hypothetical protein VFT31_04745 [Kribbella sp.]|nr:hypothetical protein [Kribbella sp.]